MPEGLVIDADGFPVDLWDNANYGVVDHAYPAPQPEIQWAGSVDTEGASPASRKHQNRTITLTVEATTAAALYTLQQKAAKVYREGGTLTRTLADGRTITFDLLATEQYEPSFDQTFHLAGVSTARIQFVAKPYGRGPEVSGTTHTGTNGYCVFVETDIAGDVPALGRLVVGNSDASYSPNRMMYGARSRYYSSSAGAALFYQAEAGEALGAAPATGQAGSTGSTNKVMAHSDVGTTGVAAFSVSSNGGSRINHVGDYRVFVRAWALSGNSGIVSTRLVWYPQSDGATNTYVENGWVPIVNSSGTALKGAWYLVDLGTVSLPVALVGDQQWSARVQSKSTVATDDVEYDSVIFMPTTEGYGVAKDGFVLPTARSAQIDYRSVYCNIGSTTWARARSFEGDYLYVPPSGSEARSAQIMVVASGSAAHAATPDTVIPNPSLPVLTARLHWTPRYLVVPKPA